MRIGIVEIAGKFHTRYSDWFVTLTVGSRSISFPLRFSSSAILVKLPLPPSDASAVNKSSLAPLVNFTSRAVAFNPNGAKGGFGGGS